MISGIKILKWTAGFFGSLFMFLAMILLLLTLIAGSMVENVANLDDSIANTMTTFVAENREDARTMISDMLAKGSFELTQLNLGLLCSNKESLSGMGEGQSEQVRQQVASFQNALSDDVCSNLDARPFNETKTMFLDSLIDTGINSMINLPQTDELKKIIREYGNDVLGYRPMFIGISIMLYVLGVFLTFAGVGFDWMKGIYKVCIKTGIRLWTAALALFFVSLIQPDYIVETMRTIESQVSQAMATDAPPVVLKLIATIILDWIKLSTNPYIIIALIAGVPFVGVAVYLRIKIKHQENIAKKAVI